MSGICKYPESVCPHMTILKGKAYCGAMPCQLTGELPKRTNADKIRNMTDEELARFLSEFQACCNCESYDKKVGRCRANFPCVKEYAEAIIGDWLQQPAED